MDDSTRHTIHDGRVYLGGPIDGTDGRDQNWRELTIRAFESMGIEFYDPLTANASQSDPTKIVTRNMQALYKCSIAMFGFPNPGQFGFGSPIEIWLISEHIPVVVWTPSRLPHIYLRYLAEHREVTIRHRLPDALDAIASSIMQTV